MTEAGPGALQSSQEIMPSRVTVTVPSPGNSSSAMRATVGAGQLIKVDAIANGYVDCVDLLKQQSGRRVAGTDQLGQHRARG